MYNVTDNILPLTPYVVFLKGLIGYKQRIYMLQGSKLQIICMSYFLNMKD